MPSTAQRPRVLVVEDDERIRASLRLALIDEGYDVAVAADAAEALDMCNGAMPDVLLIDVLLPGMDGFELCRSIRRSSAVPIVMVTARDDSHDVVAGLEAGADDYVTKPYNIKELAARLRSLLRRTQGLLESDASEPTRFGPLELRLDEGLVLLDGVDVELTPTELRLLEVLVNHQRRVLSRDQLLTRVWGHDYYGDERVVDAHIRRLRAKVEPDPAAPTYVLTVRGLGYRFDPGS